MNADNIPRELRELRGWLLRKGKVPHYANGAKRSGTQGAPEDRAQLVRFDEALAALATGGKRYSGLGLAMLPEWGVYCVDLDHCIGADGAPNDTAKAFIAAAQSTYIEISPSGRGLHIWMRGKLEDAKNIPAGVEVFCAKGYLTMTGNVYTGGA